MWRQGMAIALLIASVLPAHAADVTRGKQLTLGNSKEVTSCIACHGPNGEGNAQAGYPIIAGLSAEYIAQQLHSFKQGTRKNALMAPIASALTESDIADLAAYYASLVWPTAMPAATSNASLQAQGATLAHTGNWNKNLPACFSCHGPDGEGVGTFPRIAGQHESYIAAQLQAWRKGTRHNDRLKLMQSSAEKLMPDDIKALALYLSRYRAEEASETTGAQKIAQGKAAQATKSDEPKKPEKPARSPKPFSPPPESEIPNDGFGAMVRQGKNIFVDTQRYAKEYVGNGLNCVNCHLDSGRKADSAPMWGAYVLYPAFRSKNEKVNTMQERIQGCFRFSQNGKEPAADSETVTALVSYFFWLAKGAPTGLEIPGRGYPKVPEPKQRPDANRGAVVYAQNCALCHGPNGQGQKVGEHYAFPPLWGGDSFNGGAGMSRVETAVGFIKANMPLGRGNSLSDQEAWDVATFMNSHERPADPRKQDRPAASKENPAK